MAGLIRREGEASAKRVGTQAPFENLSVGTLGRVTTGPDGRPQVMQTRPVAQAQSGIFNVGAQAGERAGEFVDPTAGFGQELLAGGRGMLADVAGFDPLNAAEDRFQRLQSVLAPQRDRQREGLEARLLAQGRLDSGQGNLLGGELERGFAAEDTNLLNKLFLEGEAAQAQARTQAQGLGQAGAAIGGGLFGQQLQAPQGAQQLDQGLLQALGASGNIGQSFLNRDISRAQAINSFNASPAAGGKGGGALGAIGTIGGGILGGFATGGNPAGIAAGAQAGGALGNLFT